MISFPPSWPGVGFCLLEHIPQGSLEGNSCPGMESGPSWCVVWGSPLECNTDSRQPVPKGRRHLPFGGGFSRPVLYFVLSVVRVTRHRTSGLVVYLSQQVLVFLSVVLILSYLIGTMDGLENDFAIPPSFWGMSIPSSSSGSFTSCDQEEGFTTQVSNVCICRAW